MASLNPCRCGNIPERVTTSSGLVRISCVLSRCPDLVCLRTGVAERAWNEANPSDDAPTLPQNEVPAVRSLDAVDVFFRTAYAGSRLQLMTEEEFNARNPLLVPGAEFKQAMFAKADTELPTPVRTMERNKAQSGSMWNAGTPWSDDKAEILGRLSKVPLTREIDVELPEDWSEV